MIAVDVHTPIVKTIAWKTEADTQLACEKLAASAALSHAFIELRGDLGAGKTTFVRHLLRALGVQGRIKSPTYAVMEPHEAPASGNRPAFSISHFDFYRFNDPREWEEAGLRDVFAAPGLKLAEWPQNAAGFLPVCDLLVSIDTQADDSRVVTLTANTGVGRQLLEAMTA